MNWINIHTETLRGEEFIGAEPLERATWLALLGWSCAQENDGIILGCRSWGNRKWQQLCGVTQDEIHLESDLYQFEGDNLVVNFYPIEQQAAVKAKREAGKKGGRPRKADSPKPLQYKGEKPHGLSELKGSSQDTLNEKESKVIVKERKGKETKCVSIPTIQEFLAYLQTAAPKLNNEWTPERITRCGTNIYETYIDQGWKDGKGKQIKNWKTKSRNAISYRKPWEFGKATPDQNQQQMNYAREL